MKTITRAILFLSLCLCASAANNVLYVFGSSSTACKPLWEYVDGSGSITTTQACFSSSSLGNPSQAAVFNNRLIVILKNGTSWNAVSIATALDPSQPSNWVTVSGATSTNVASLACTSSFCTIAAKTGASLNTIDGVTWTQPGPGPYQLAWSTSSKGVGFSPTYVYSFWLSASTTTVTTTAGPFASGAPVVSTSSTSAALLEGTTLYSSADGSNSWVSTTNCGAGISGSIGVSSQSGTFPSSIYYFNQTQYCSSDSSGTFGASASSLYKNSASQTVSMSSAPTYACSAGPSTVFLLQSGGIQSFNGTSPGGTLGALASLPSAPAICASGGTMSGSFTAPPPSARVIIVTYD